MIFAEIRDNIYLPFVRPFFLQLSPHHVHIHVHHHHNNHVCVCIVVVVIVVVVVVIVVVVVLAVDGGDDSMSGQDGCAHHVQHVERVGPGMIR